MSEMLDLAKGARRAELRSMHIADGFDEDLLS